MKQDGKNTGWDNTLILAVSMIAFGVSVIRIKYGSPGYTEYLVVFLTMCYFAGKYFSDRKRKLAQARVIHGKMLSDTEALRSIPGANGKDPFCPSCASDTLYATGRTPAVHCPMCGTEYATVEDAINAIEGAR